MRYFPIFYDLEGRKVVVVGGGEEALRKVRLLLKTNARILVIWLLSHGWSGWRGALCPICWTVRRWFMRLILNSIIL